MTRVLGVIRDSNFSASRLGLESMLSANITFTPSRKNAKAVETKVYDGTITSSPGFSLHNIAHISSASVPDVISRHFVKPNLS